MSDDLRTPEQRRSDVESHLRGDIDCWVATASPEGRAHLVPLSFAYDGHNAILATPGTSVTARNIGATGSVRLALGSTYDVVMIDAEASVLPTAEVDEALRALYVDQAGWDPSTNPNNVFILVVPVRIQAWKNEPEIAGRDVMRDGRFLVELDRGGT